jgi:hypothetical protein
MGEKLQEIDVGNDFLNWTSIVQEIIARTGKWDCIKFKSCCTAK